MLVEKIKYVHIFPPHLYRANDGILYLIPMWTPVSDDTTLDDIEWIDPYKKEITFIKKIKSSKGDTYYTIDKIGDQYRCNCPGAQFHNRICKHIKQLTHITI